MRKVAALTILLTLAMPAAAEPANEPSPITSLDYWLGVLRCPSHPTIELRASCYAGAARLRDVAVRSSAGAR